MAKRPVVLVVLDGWGYREEREGNAIALATTPTWDGLVARFPGTLLNASGLAVGLPEGQMGNSEVGHLNLGAGRVVMQDLVRIGESIRDRSFFANRVFTDACDAANKAGGTVHLVGLVGNGGVHAIDKHLFALIDLCADRKVPRIAIHALLDGRDTMPRSGAGYMQQLLDYAKGRAVVASVGGRYFGMDRDKRWDRIEKWYRAVVDGVGPQGHDPLEVIRAAYERNETDEFIIPTVIVEDGKAVAPMRDGDSVICFNYRADRMRQIVAALTQPDFDGFDVHARPKLTVATMTAYDRRAKLPVAFPPQSMANIVGEVVSNAGMSMFRTAETEKYAHVTYFFNGGVETPFPHEDRRARPQSEGGDVRPHAGNERRRSDRRALCVDRKARARFHSVQLRERRHGWSHGLDSGNDSRRRDGGQMSCSRACVGAERAGARIMVTADHGNCEMMIDPETGGPHTAHTTNPVPFIVVDPDGDRPMRAGGALCDVGPTLLTMLGLEQPSEMTGVDLRTTGERA